MHVVDAEPPKMSLSISSVLNSHAKLKGAVWGNKSLKNNTFMFKYVRKNDRSRKR